MTQKSYEVKRPPSSGTSYRFGMHLLVTNFKLGIHVVRDLKWDY